MYQNKKFYFEFKIWPWPETCGELEENEKTFKELSGQLKQAKYQNTKLNSAFEICIEDLNYSKDLVSEVTEEFEKLSYHQVFWFNKLKFNENTLL